MSGRPALAAWPRPRASLRTPARRQRRRDVRRLHRMAQRHDRREAAGAEQQAARPGWCRRSRTRTQREIRDFGTDAALPANPAPAAESLAQDQSTARTTLILLAENTVVLGVLARSPAKAAGQAARAGGLWLCSVRCPSGLTAVTVASGCRVSCQPQRCTAIR